MRFDHVAVTADNIADSVAWYIKHFRAKVLYQDDSWAFLQMGGTKLALVSPAQHPPHVAFSVREDQLKAASQSEKLPIDSHRDGTQGIYLRDPAGNLVELITYPPGQTLYHLAEDHNSP